MTKDDIEWLFDTVQDFRSDTERRQQPSTDHETTRDAQNDQTEQSRQREQDGQREHEQRQVHEPGTTEAAQHYVSSEDMGREAITVDGVTGFITERTGLSKRQTAGLGILGVLFLLFKRMSWKGVFLWTFFFLFVFIMLAAVVGQLLLFLALATLLLMPVILPALLLTEFNDTHETVMRLPKVEDQSRRSAVIASLWGLPVAGLGLGLLVL